MKKDFDCTANIKRTSSQAQDLSDTTLYSLLKCLSIRPKDSLLSCFSSHRQEVDYFMPPNRFNVLLP